VAGIQSALLPHETKKITLNPPLIMHVKYSRVKVSYLASWGSLPLGKRLRAGRPIGESQGGLL